MRARAGQEKKACKGVRDRDKERERGKKSKRAIREREREREREGESKEKMHAGLERRVRSGEDKDSSLLVIMRLGRARGTFTRLWEQTNNKA